MKRTFAAAFAASLSLSLVAAAPAPAAPAAAPSPAKLAAQIKALQKQLTTLQTQVKRLQTLTVASFAYTTCGIAATADAFQGLDAVAFAPVSDPLNACPTFNVTRQPGVKTTSVFQQLLNFFK